MDDQVGVKTEENEYIKIWRQDRAGGTILRCTTTTGGEGTNGAFTPREVPTHTAGEQRNDTTFNVSGLRFVGTSKLRQESI